MWIKLEGVECSECNSSGDINDFIVVCLCLCKGFECGKWGFELWIMDDNI